MSAPGTNPTPQDVELAERVTNALWNLMDQMLEGASLDTWVYVLRRVQEGLTERFLDNDLAPPDSTPDGGTNFPP
jgi:hypothetical protein